MENMNKQDVLKELNTLKKLQAVMLDESIPEGYYIWETITKRAEFLEDYKKRLDPWYNAQETIKQLAKTHPDIQKYVDHLKHEAEWRAKLLDSYSEEKGYVQDLLKTKDIRNLLSRAPQDSELLQNHDKAVSELMDIYFQLQEDLRNSE